MNLGEEIMHQLYLFLSNRHPGDLISAEFQSWRWKGRADLVRLTGWGYVFEYEIKTRMSDFENEFKKSGKLSKHNDWKRCWFNSGSRISPNYFCFVVPEDMSDEVACRLLENGYRKYGVMYYTGSFFFSKKKCQRMHDMRQENDIRGKEGMYELISKRNSRELAAHHKLALLSSGVEKGRIIGISGLNKWEKELLGW